jgi:hypothetical protein
VGASQGEDLSADEDLGLDFGEEEHLRWKMDGQQPEDVRQERARRSRWKSKRGPNGRKCGGRRSPALTAMMTALSPAPAGRTTRKWEKRRTTREEIQGFWARRAGSAEHAERKSPEVNEGPGSRRGWIAAPCPRLSRASCSALMKPKQGAP